MIRADDRPIEKRPDAFNGIGVTRSDLFHRVQASFLSQAQSGSAKRVSKVLALKVGTAPSGRLER